MFATRDQVTMYHFPIQHFIYFVLYFFVLFFTSTKTDIVLEIPICKRSFFLSTFRWAHCIVHSLGVAAVCIWFQLDASSICVNNRIINEMLHVNNAHWMAERNVRRRMESNHFETDCDTFPHGGSYSRNTIGFVWRNPSTHFTEYNSHLFFSVGSLIYPIRARLESVWSWYASYTHHYGVRMVIHAWLGRFRAYE